MSDVAKLEHQGEYEGMAAHWRRSVKNGQKDAVLALLTILLPKISKLQLDRWWCVQDKTRLTTLGINYLCEDTNTARYPDCHNINDANIRRNVLCLVTYPTITDAILHRDLWIRSGRNEGTHR